MLTHDEMIGLQAEKHELVDAHNFGSREQYVLHLIHSFAYVQAAEFSKEKTVLDLGCNTGYGTELLSKTAKRVVGVDVSKEALAIAKERYGDIDFQLIDGKRLPFDDNEFDIVISCQVIEHIVDYQLYLDELKRVLSPTGIAVFTTPNALLRLDPGMKPWNKFHVREFTHSELKKLLEQHFSSVSVLGLSAEESTYLVEKNRLSRALDAARKKQQRSRFWRLMKVMRKLKPTNIAKSLATSFQPKEEKPNKEIDKSFIKQHSLNDLYYRTDELDLSLDLLALCTNDGSALKEIQQKIKMG